MLLPSISHYSFIYVFSCQKFGDLTVRQIERLRCRHRIQVLQAHEDTTKENSVSKQTIKMSLNLLKGQFKDIAG